MRSRNKLPRHRSNRSLHTIYRGGHQVAKIVQVPSPEEEDDKRLLRCRGNLLRDRIQHMNRIRGLLNLQGVQHIDPNRSNCENELVNLRTGDGRSFPRQLMNEVRREGKLLGTVVRMLKEVEAEIAGIIRDERKRRHPAQRGQKNHPIARRLAEIHGVGPQTAGILATEVFYRGFKNRREVATSRVLPSRARAERWIRGGGTPRPRSSHLKYLRSTLVIY
jgi:transposase